MTLRIQRSAGTNRGLGEIAHVVAWLSLEIIRTVAELRHAVPARFRGAHATVGLVPTMGALHDGHLTLARSAKMDNARVIATLFVNPKQFSPTEDLTALIRATKRRMPTMLAGGWRRPTCSRPTSRRVYPEGFCHHRDSVGGITQSSLKARRGRNSSPWRRDRGGEAACCMALPDRAYFGEKDFQQLQVVRKPGARPQHPGRQVVARADDPRSRRPRAVLAQPPTCLGRSSARWQPRCRR